jgi:hypothetical protein
MNHHFGLGPEGLYTGALQRCARVQAKSFRSEAELFFYWSASMSTHPLQPSVCHVRTVEQSVAQFQRKAIDEDAASVVALKAGYESMSESLHRARNCGVALIQVADLLKPKHGEWIRWTESEFRGGLQAAQRRIRIAREWSRIEPLIEKRSINSIAQAIQFLSSNGNTNSSQEGSVSVKDDVYPPDEVDNSHSQATTETVVDEGLQTTDSDRQEVDREGDDSSENATTPSEGAESASSEQTETNNLNGHAPSNGRTLCARCQRDGKVKGCDMCKQLNRKPDAAPKPPKEKEEEAAPKDAFGNEVPKGCRDALFDPWIQESFDLMAECLDKLLRARLGEGMKKRARFYPTIKSGDVCDGVQFAIQYLDQVVDHVRENRPAAVCPACQGEKCCECQMSGLVTRKAYMEAKEKEKCSS